MSRARQLVIPIVLVALLVLPAVAEAQMATRVPSGFSTGEVRKDPHLITEQVGLMVQVDGFDSNHRSREFVVVGYDAVLNVTIRNGRDAWVNDTLTFNASENFATSPDNVSVSVPPQTVQSFLVTVHPEDVGESNVLASLADTTVSGENSGPASDVWSGIAVAPVVIRVLEPAPATPDTEYRRMDYHGRPDAEQAVSARVRPEVPVVFRVEIENLLDAPVPGFQLELRETMRQTSVGTVSVDPLEAGERREFTFPEWRGMSLFGEHGPGGYMEGQLVNFWVLAKHEFGEDVREHLGADFTLENGALTIDEPAARAVEVVSSVGIDLYITQEMRLGVPARLKVNVSNHGTDAADGMNVRVNLMPPGGADYGVQGPELLRLAIGDLPPGATHTEVFEFTPRVTGRWQVDLNAQWAGRGVGRGGLQFEVPVPVAVRVTDSDGGLSGTARIGESVDFDLTVLSSVRLDDAVLHIASGNNNYRRSEGTDNTGGPRFAGVLSGLVEAQPKEVNLGTVRPGEPVNVTFTITARASGNHLVIPYVLADGFAYTSYGATLDWAPQGTDNFGISAATRTIPIGLALLPFTVTLALVVGTWTLRTRFVK